MYTSGCPVCTCARCVSVCDVQCVSVCVCMCNACLCVYACNACLRVCNAGNACVRVCLSLHESESWEALGPHIKAGRKPSLSLLRERKWCPTEIVLIGPHGSHTEKGLIMSPSLLSAAKNNNDILCSWLLIGQQHSYWSASVGTAGWIM